jgi:hypothetical protein
LGNAAHEIFARQLRQNHKHQHGDQRIAQTARISQILQSHQSRHQTADIEDKSFGAQVDFESDRGILLHDLPPVEKGVPH